LPKRPIITKELHAMPHSSIHTSIEVLAHIDLEGKIHPLRFRLETQDQDRRVVRVEKVLDYKEAMIAGQRTRQFSCRSVIEDLIHHYELSYELATCRWYLSKWS